VTEVMGVSRGAIYEYQPGSDSIVYRAVHVVYTPPDVPEDDPLGTAYSLDDSPTDRHILLAGEIVVEHLSDEKLPADRRLAMEPWSEKTVLSVPLFFRREPIGILRLYDMLAERPFGPDDVDLVRSIAELAGAALHNARLYREQADHAERLIGLFETSRVLTSSFELDDLVEGVSAGIARLLGEQPGTDIWLRDAQGRLVPRAVLDEGDGEDLDAAPADPLALTAIERQRPVHHSAAEGTSLVVPFVTRGYVEGFIAVSFPGFRAFSQAEIEALQVLANQGAVAFANAALYRQVQRQAVRDGLTGLFNHRYFQDRLAQETARARRYQLPLSLLMIDVDDFKRFNDEHGHQLGDEVLREIGTILQANVRRGIDLPCRYGGEEFAVILPHTDASGAACLGRRLHQRLGDLDEELPPPGEGATVVGERLREAVEERRFAGHGGRRYAHLTVSIGVACLADAGDAEALMDCADKALFVAKRAGKNRIEVFER
jgi:diguanylate cyclase (GGDEF)-like protein